MHWGLCQIFVYESIYLTWKIVKAGSLRKMQSLLPPSPGSPNQETMPQSWLLKTHRIWMILTSHSTRTYLFTKPGNHAAVLAFKDSSNLNDLNQPQHKIFVEAVCWLDQRHEEKEPQSKRTRWDAYWDSKNNYKEKSSWWEVLRLGIIFRWGSTSDLLSCMATLRFLSFHQYWARSQGWNHYCRYLNQPFK